jgi:hypothetical protein
VSILAAVLYLAGAPQPAILVFAIFVAFPCLVGACALVYFISEIIHARA